MSSAADHSYIPSYAPFHVEADGFRVWEKDGRFTCAGPTAVTYRGDMVGVVRFIERERGRMANAKA